MKLVGAKTLTSLSRIRDIIRVREFPSREIKVVEGQKSHHLRVFVNWYDGETVKFGKCRNTDNLPARLAPPISQLKYLSRQDADRYSILFLHLLRHRLRSAR